MGRISFVVGLACVGWACTPGGLPQPCAVYIAPSAIVNVSGAGGAPVIAATVTFVSDGGESGACEENSGGEYFCGEEVEGLLTITIEKPSFTTQVVEVEVGADTCHVLTETVDIVLEPEVCSGEQVPSILARVVDSGGRAVSGAAVRWRRAEAAPAGAADCQPSGNPNFPYACGLETSGELVVVATAGGFVQAFEEVTVEATFCHVITEEVTLEMTPL